MCMFTLLHYCNVGMTMRNKKNLLETRTSFSCESRDGEYLRVRAHAVVCRNAYSVPASSIKASNLNQSLSCSYWSHRLCSSCGILLSIVNTVKVPNSYLYTLYMSSIVTRYYKINTQLITVFK